MGVGVGLVGSIFVRDSRAVRYYCTVTPAAAAAAAAASWVGETQHLVALPSGARPWVSGDGSRGSVPSWDPGLRQLFGCVRVKGFESIRMSAVPSYVQYKYGHSSVYSAKKDLGCAASHREQVDSLVLYCTVALQEVDDRRSLASGRQAKKRSVLGCVCVCVRCS